MSGYSVEQLKAISEYRAQNGLGAVISDDAVVSIMQKDMIKTGKIFPGFEFLAESPSSKQPAAAKSNVFGTGFNSNETIGLCVEKEQLPGIPLTQPAKKIGVAEKEGIDFLKTITGEADSVVKEHEKESGVLTSIVNSWQEVFNQEVAKSTITNEIKSAKLDIKTLELAAKGKSVTKNYLTGETGTISFEEMFKKQRGVEYNITNVVNCKQESEKFARIKTASEMINMTKQELSFLTRGDAQSSAGIQESSSAIIKAFNLSGITNKNDMNAFLSRIEEKYKDHPDIKKYGGNLRFEKLPNGKIYMMSTTNEGNNVPAGNEQLKIVAKEMSLRLDKTYAEALGINIPENATQEEITAMSKKVYDEHQRSYEKAFEEAFGSKDVKALADRYVQTQQQSVANIEAGLNIASMALMIVPGAAAGASGWLLKGSVAMKSTSIGARAAETFNLVDKSKKLYKAANAVNDFLKGDSAIAKTLTKGKLNLGRQAILSTASTGNMILNPTTLLEQLSSENGMSAEEWKNWEKGVVQNTVYMAAGMGSSKIAEQGAAMYKTKALVKALKQTGKTTDEIAAMVKANPVKFPNDVVKSFNSIDNIAKALQISSEAAIDLSSTYMLNEAMGNGGLQKQDWIMSVGFALSGGALQKQFASMSTEAKAKYLQKAFKDINLSKFEAYNILSTMDKISSGEIRAKKEKPENNPFSFKPHQNDVINHVNEADTGIPAAGKRVQNAESKPKLTEETFLDELCSLYELDKNEIIKDPDAIKEINGIYSVYEKNSAEINNFIMKNEKGEYKYSKEFISWSLQKCLEGKYKCSDIKLFAAAYDIAQNPNPKYNPEIGISKLDFDLIQELVKSEIDVQGSDTFENGRTHSFEEVFDVLSMMDNDSQKKAVIELLQKDYTFGSDIPDITKIKTFKNDGDVKEFFSLIERLNAKKSERSPKQFLNIANVITSPKLEKMAVDLIDKGTEFDFTERLLKIADDGGYERINKLLTNPTEANKKELLIIESKIDDSCIKNFKGTGIFACEKLNANDIYQIRYEATEVVERDLLNPDKNYSKEQIIMLAKASDKTYNTIIEHGLLDKYSAEDAAIIGYNYNKLKELGLLDIPDLRVEDMLVFLNRPETAKEFIDDPELSKLGAIGFDSIKKLLDNPEYRNESIEYIKSIYKEENMKPFLSSILKDSMDCFGRINKIDAKYTYEKFKKICNNQNRTVEEKKMIVESLLSEDFDPLSKLIDDSEIEVQTILLRAGSWERDIILDFYDVIKDNNTLSKEDKNALLLCVNKNNIEIATKLCQDKDFPKELAAGIVRATNRHNVEFTTKLCQDKDFPIDHIADIVRTTNEHNIDIATKLCQDKDFPKESISNILFNINKENKDAFLKVYLNKKFDNKLLAPLVADGYVFFVDYMNLDFNSLTKTQKRKLLNDLLIHKNVNSRTPELKKLFPIIPTSDTEYSHTMKKLSQSLNISLEKLPYTDIKKYNDNINSLTQTLETMDLTYLHEINLSLPHSEFVKKVETILSDLPIDEQNKVKDYFGFSTKDGKLYGYPNNTNKDLNLSEITDSKTIEVVKKLQPFINEYKTNNYITVKDFPALNRELKELSKVMPELYNQIDGSGTPVDTIKTLQRVIQNQNFKKLSDEDKKIMITAVLLHNTDKFSNDSFESAYDAFFISKKFGFTDNEAKKVYKIVQNSDLIDKFMNTTKDTITKKYRGQRLEGTDRKNTFDLMAFNLKDGNNFSLAQMLYSSKDVDGLTRHLDKLLEKRINEFKSAEFTLPQTPKETYADTAQEMSVKRDDAEYNVKVVNASEIKDFYAFIHTPEAAFASTGFVSRDAKFANFEAFKNIADDKVICTSYVGNDKYCGAADHGFIFEVDADKQYVGMGHDIFSLSKNIPDMLVEYYNNNGLKAASNKGEKYWHRTMISTKLKEKMGISDAEYIQRLDNLKAKSDGNTLNMEKINEIDPEFANAYKEFLAVNASDSDAANALMRTNGWNEVLVSNPEISAIYTKDFDNIPVEYLKKAQDENLPIVILK